MALSPYPLLSHSRFYDARMLRVLGNFIDVPHVSLWFMRLAAASMNRA